MSKVRDSPYPIGQARDWVKKTRAQRGTFTIAGFALDGGNWDGLYLGRRNGWDLIYAARSTTVSTGSHRPDCASA